MSDCTTENEYDTPKIIRDLCDDIIELGTDLSRNIQRVNKLEDEVQNIAACIGAGATLDEVCSMLDKLDCIKNLRKGS